MHYRATIPEMTARHVVVNLLASGQVARMKAGRLVTRPGSRPMLQRLWGTVGKDGEAAYLAAGQGRTVAADPPAAGSPWPLPRPVAPRGPGRSSGSLRTGPTRAPRRTPTGMLRPSGRPRQVGGSARRRPQPAVLTRRVFLERSSTQRWRPRPTRTARLGSSQVTGSGGQRGPVGSPWYGRDWP